MVFAEGTSRSGLDLGHHRHSAPAGNLKPPCTLPEFRNPPQKRSTVRSRITRWIEVQAVRVSAGGPGRLFEADRSFDRHSDATEERNPGTDDTINARAEAPEYAKAHLRYEMGEYFSESLNV
ncbi:MAG: hypothetical protein ACRDTD_30155, partial [Pseudonocardiaceae bacterium]